MGFFRVLAHDLDFLEFEFELSDDSFRIVYQLDCDSLCKIWERIILIWFSFRRFLWTPVFLFVQFVPSSSVARKWSQQQRYQRRAFSAVRAHPSGAQHLARLLRAGDRRGSQAERPQSVRSISPCVGLGSQCQQLHRWRPMNSTERCAVPLLVSSSLVAFIASCVG